MQNIKYSWSSTAPSNFLRKWSVFPSIFINCNPSFNTSYLQTLFFFEEYLWVKLEILPYRQDTCLLFLGIALLLFVNFIYHNFLIVAPARSVELSHGTIRWKFGETWWPHASFRTFFDIIHCNFGLLICLDSTEE